MSQILATADIGSNTAHLLIAETDGKFVRRVENLSRWLSLGESVALNGVIDARQVKEMIDTLRSFSRAAVKHGAPSIHVFATEAVRKARNHNDILTLVRQELSVDVQVISPEREVDLAISGSLLDCGGDLPALFFDVGGGSGQFARITKAGRTDFLSLPLGTGTLRAQHKLGDPPRARAVVEMRDAISAMLEPVIDFDKATRVIGCGGVARGIWKALHPDREKTVRRYEIEYLARAMEDIGSSLAMSRFGVGKSRALTLLPGCLVIDHFLRATSHAEFRVSEFGIREGAILALANGSIAEGSP